MDFPHIYYKEIPVDEDHIFSTKVTENNEVEQIKFKKSKIYAISWLLIDQDTQSNVSLPKVEGNKALSNFLRTYVEEKNKFHLDWKIYKESYFDINVLFQKRTDVLINGFHYYDTTTQKQETIEFYDYYYHLRNLVLRGNMHL